MNDGIKTIINDDKNLTNINTDTDNLMCPHCGKPCFPKEKRVRVGKLLCNFTKKEYRYSYYFFECKDCGYCSPRSKIDLETARQLFLNRTQ